MKLLVNILLAIFLVLYVAPNAYAQKQDWKITNFTSYITVQEDGVVKIEEDIEVEFLTQKHGIFREIPYVYEGDGEEYYTQLNVVDIRRNGEEEKYQTTTENSYINVRIGNENKQIKGAHTYTITYTARGVLQGFEDYDELYWNTTGNYWGVPIERAQTTVKLEKGNVQSARCFTGEKGAQRECAFEIIDENTAFFETNKALSPGEGMTVVAAYPKNTIPLLTVEKPKTLLQRVMQLPSMLLFSVILILGIGIVFWNWARRGRDFIFFKKYIFDPHAKKIVRPLTHEDTIVVEYTPPQDLRPAEIGVLMDERADTLDITSTIIDFATRGYLKIEEIPKKWMFGSVDYKLIKKQKDTKELKNYEKELYERLFEGKKEIKVSGLKKSFYEDLKKVKEKLYQDLIAKNYFPNNPEKVRNRYVGISIGLIVLGVLISVFLGINADNEYIASTGAAVVVVGGVSLIFSRSMSRRTAKGAELYRRAQGYRLFLENVEKHKQQFLEKKNIFNEILPYAIMFGLTEKLAKAMEDMDIKPSSTTWYSGTKTLNTAAFASHVNTFSSSVGGAIASKPNSSGFSSSGGSSGGGFGGGGGGSW